MGTRIYKFMLLLSMVGLQAPNVCDKEVGMTVQEFRYHLCAIYQEEQDRTPQIEGLSLFIYYREGRTDESQDDQSQGVISELNFKNPELRTYKGPQLERTFLQTIPTHISQELGLPEGANMKILGAHCLLDLSNLIRNVQETLRLNQTSRSKYYMLEIPFGQNIGRPDSIKFAQLHILPNK